MINILIREKNINNLDSYINNKFMIEEQKRKCEEIINYYKIKLGEVDISLLINPFSSIFQSVHQYAVENITYMTISLAKVFNKDITEEEAKKIVSVLKDTEKRQDIESIGWAIANYFLPRKIEKIINSYEEKYKKEFKEINTLGFHIDGQHTSPIVRMFGIILISWLVAFFEYCCQVPANRIGFNNFGGPFSLVQLKVIQEVISLLVFVLFSLFFFQTEAFKWNHLVAFGLLILAVYFIFK